MSKDHWDCMASFTLTAISLAVSGPGHLSQKNVRAGKDLVRHLCAAKARG